jgi:hypothetical protein
MTAGLLSGWHVLALLMRALIIMET